MLRRFLKTAGALLVVALLAAGFWLATGIGVSPAEAAESPYLEQPIGVVVFDGDSLTAGSEASDPYPSQIMRDFAPGACWYNLGIGGLRIKDIVGMAPARVDRRFNPRLGRNVVVVWAGTNDLALWNHMASAVYKRLEQYCLERREQGFSVLVLTMLPRCDRACLPAFEERRQAVNRRLRQSWPDFADGLVDVAADPLIGSPGCESDLQYWVRGGVHLTNKGLAVVATHVRDALIQLQNGGVGVGAASD